MIFVLQSRAKKEAILSKIIDEHRGVIVSARWDGRTCEMEVDDDDADEVQEALEQSGLSFDDSRLERPSRQGFQVDRPESSSRSERPNGPWRQANDPWR